MQDNTEFQNRDTDDLSGSRVRGLVQIGDTVGLDVRFVFQVRFLSSQRAVLLYFCLGAVRSVCAKTVTVCI